MSAHVSATRRHFFRVLGGVSVAAVSGLAALHRGVLHGVDGELSVIGSAGRATEPAVRERLVGEIRFPVAGFVPGELVCLNNFNGFSNANGPCGHVGVDIGVDIGGTVPHELVACVGGTVESIGFARAPGDFVVLRGDDGRWYRYHHCSEIEELLEEGQWVEAGDPLGRMGSTGNTSWRHLHFEVWIDSVIPRDGTPLDPVPLMPIPGGVRLAPSSACGA
ncbi:MAG: M23 family metallopeptidase [Actinomycetota bacterium]